MSGKLDVTFVAREPLVTTLELQCDNVVCLVIVKAAGLRIDIDSVDLDALNGARHDMARSRGQTSTSIDAITKHAIITANPPLNEPVRWLMSPMILGPKYPPILAVQLMNPTAAAAAEPDRNAEGNAQNAGK